MHAWVWDQCRVTTKAIRVTDLHLVLSLFVNASFRFLPLFRRLYFGGYGANLDLQSRTRKVMIE